MEPLPANTSEYLRLYADELGAKIQGRWEAKSAARKTMAKPSAQKTPRSPIFSAPQFKNTAREPGPRTGACRAMELLKKSSSGLQRDKLKLIPHSVSTTYSPTWDTLQLVEGLLQQTL